MLALVTEQISSKRLESRIQLADLLVTFMTELEQRVEVLGRCMVGIEKKRLGVGFLLRLQVESIGTLDADLGQL